LQFAVPAGCRCVNKETVALQLLTSVLTGVPEATSDGTVLPIAWNMLDATKINPDARRRTSTRLCEKRWPPLPLVVPEAARGLRVVTRQVGNTGLHE
jgi:hypothetical protein